MNLSTSTDGINFTPPLAVTVPQGTAVPIPGYLIGISAVAARYVKFDILSNYGDSYTGLSDVQFLAGAGSVVATNTTLGQGCIRAASSFYEFFSSPASFDLSNSAISMAFTGTGYVVLPGLTAFVPPSGAATTLGLSDDSEVSVALSGTLPHAGGTTSSLQVCSNGFVSVAAGNGTSFTPDVATMLAAPQTAWWNWHDYNPATAGSGQVKFEQIGGIAYVTWDGVYDFGGTSAANANTFQFQFELATGFVHLVFQSMSTQGNARLVGYSPGGPSIDPGNSDLSVAVPATFTIGLTDVLPLALAGGSRPVLGTNWTLNVTNVPATGTIGLDVFGLSDPNIPDLGFLGAPGCGTRASLDLMNLWLVAGATHNYSLPLPNNPALVNLHLYTQADRAPARRQLAARRRDHVERHRRRARQPVGPRRGSRSALPADDEQPPPVRWSVSGRSGSGTGWRRRRADRAGASPRRTRWPVGKRAGTAPPSRAGDREGSTCRRSRARRRSPRA
jgi:hypothetical protein